METRCLQCLQKSPKTHGFGGCTRVNRRNVALQTAFFDIEVDFDQERGYSRPEDPFNRITAISVYLDWLDQLITLVVPPRHMSMETAQEIAAEFENTIVFEREEDMLKMFLDVIR